MAADRSGGKVAQHGPEVQRIVLGSLPDLPDVGIYRVDDRGNIVEVTPRAEALLARPAAGLLGQDAHDLLHRDSRGHPTPRAECPMMHAFVGDRTAYAEEAWYVRGDGSPLRISWMITPCLLDDGSKGAMVIFHEASPGATTQWEADDPAAPLSDIERLALLAETTTRLTSTLDVQETLRRLERLVVPRLADWIIVDLFTEEHEVRRTTVVGHDRGVLRHRDDLTGPMPPVPQESTMPLSRALRGAASTLAGPETYQGPPDSPVAIVQQRLFKATGLHSAAIAPIRGLREVLGALTLGRSEHPRRFGDDELALLNDIARRTGLALDNARLYQRQRRVAETMQRHLLPHLPTVPGIEMATRYVAAPESSDVGGDWYDAFPLPDGTTALAIGDVVGHDLDAAAGMAQLRNMLRAYAWSYQEPPGQVVDRLDQAMGHIAEASMATLVFARLEQTRPGAWELHWTNAGHPPPLLITRDGRSRLLRNGQSLLLGSGVAIRRRDSTLALETKATLLLYTDGLIEARGRSLSEGLTRLRQHGSALSGLPLEEFCDHILDRVRPEDNDDDVAMLALRVPEPS